VCHDQNRAEKYIDALFKEVDYVVGLIDTGRPVRQLALGGGTPTFLSPELMKNLVSGLRERFSFAEDAERSLEIDPESIDSHYLDVLSELGFNRYSFGIQDFNPNVQKAIGRVQNEQAFRDNTAHLRGLGHDAINLDLIYGLPLQSPMSFAETVNKFIELHPSRIAVFGYAHVPWVSAHQKALERYHLPTPTERMELFGLAYELLLDAGYMHVGMDHFALPEDELIQALGSRSLTRNFMGYTTKRGLDLVALGASSISSVYGTFTQNEKDVEAYLAKAGSPLWIKGLEQTAEDQLRGNIILELMCNFFLDVAAIERKHGIDFQEHFAAELEDLTPMQSDGLLRMDDGEITVTDLGRFFIRNICMPFDEYLKKEKPAGKYSKTV
jgi:oxygen-independent coproporphyrinogen-3 oxidase